VDQACPARKVRREDRARRAKWAWLDQPALQVHLDCLALRAFLGRRAPRARWGRRAPRERPGWVCRGRQEAWGRGAGAEEQASQANLVRWAHQDRQAARARWVRVATRDLRGLREAWGSRARWARRAWGCLDPRDLPGSRAQRGLPDQGATGGVEACAATKATGVSRASEGFVGTEPPASLDRRDRRARRGLWESRACPDGDILGSGDQVDRRASRACRAFLECVEGKALPAFPASGVYGARGAIQAGKADRAHLGPWECQGRLEHQGAPARRVLTTFLSSTSTITGTSITTLQNRLVSAILHRLSQIRHSTT